MTDTPTYWVKPKHIVYIDFETLLTPTIRLNKMTLPRYIEAIKQDLPETNGITGLSTSVDYAAPMYFDSGYDRIAKLLLPYFESDECIIAAHNAAFDIRIARACLGLPQPRRVLCSMELAMAAWPNQPGGYGLANLAKVRGLSKNKLTIDLTAGKHTRKELEEYCNMDTEIGMEILRQALERVPPCELAIAESVNRTRELFLQVDAQRVSSGVDKFMKNIDVAAAQVREALGEAADHVFGIDGGNIKSVRPQAMKDALLDELGFDTQTISKKKINPEKLRRNSDAAEAVEGSSAVNKNLWYKRALSKFAGGGLLCVELGFARAHTGRFSSPQPGDAKGLNLHNMPKRNPVVAEPIRKSFTIEDGYCMVGADLSNIEYRMEGWLCDCYHTENLFNKDVMADPYAAFWEAATGQAITKKDPERQIAKAAVLGLGFMMGVRRWITELLLALADPAMRLGIEDFEAVIQKQGWSYARVSPQAKTQGTKLSAPRAVVIIAYYTRELFHQIHPEFKKTTNWLYDTVAELSRSVYPDRTLDLAYQKPHAPDRNKLGLVVDDQLDVCRSVRVACGNWPASVTWRDLDVRDPFDNGNVGLTTVQAGSKGYRHITRNIVIENVCQAAARNALCAALLELERCGHRRIFHIHDDVKLVVPMERTAVLKARDDLLAVLGPNNTLGYGPCVTIDPTEICISRSMWDDEKDSAQRWPLIEAGHPDALKGLP